MSVSESRRRGRRRRRQKRRRGYQYKRAVAAMGRSDLARRMTSPRQLELFDMREDLPW